MSLLLLYIALELFLAEKDANTNLKKILFLNKFGISAGS